MKSALGIVAILFLTSVGVAAQRDRITGTIDTGEMVILPGNVYGDAQPRYDQGLVDPAMPLSYITMQMLPSAAQQADLDRLLVQQQDPSSPNYHHWLSPEQFADRFGLSRNDIAALSSWLQSQGFEILRVARGRDYISFSGTVAMVENTFRTQIHQYEVNGETHFANATPLSIPKALAAIVIGFRGLNDFSLRPMGVHPAATEFFPDLVRPAYAGGAIGNVLAPDDIATIYDIAPLYNAGINGSGQKLVITGQTDVDLTDIENFRNGFNLPLNNLPQVVVVGPDPGTTSDLGEADLDLEWSGAVARNASIMFVTSKISSGGVFNSATYAIDNNLAPVISMSYGGCESQNASFIQSNEPIMKQANVQGITFVASSGDSGAAGCDSSTEKSATQGYAVNYPASSPEATGVGGTEFNEGGNPSTYWQASNGPNGGSAISYIPEIAWNDTSIDIAAGGGLSASGGGHSSCGVVTGTQTCSAGFAKPSWQPAVSGDKVRDVPDIAMAASADHDGFIFCSEGSCPTGDAAGILASVNGGNIVGGTSASAPVFAGIVTLMNQFLASKGQANINTQLYPLAGVSNGVFHDITSGNNNVPCTKGSTDCPASGMIGYSAATGYDLVTGLGSVDANCLSTQLKKTGDCTVTTLQLSATQVNIPPPSVTLTASVTSSAGISPGGTVNFYQGSTQVGGPVTLSSGSANFSYTPSSTAGVYSLSAAFTPTDGKSAASTSPLSQLTVGTATTTSLTLSANSVAPNTKVTLTATITGNPPDGDAVTFTDQLTGNTLASGTTSSGKTTATITPAAGTYLVVATYGGDTTKGFAGSASAHQQLGVVDFQIAASPTTITIPAPGQSGTTTLTITPLGGFSQALSYTCGTLPTGANCAFVQGSSTTEILTISTAGATGKLRSNSLLFYAMLLPGLFGFILISRTRETQLRSAKVLVLLATITLFTLSMPACGGGSSGSTSPATPSNPGTPTGSSTVTITAATSGASPISHTTQITLTIQ